MTYQEFLQKWNTEILSTKEPFIRNGQSLMNFLAEIWFEEYERISSPFYYEQTNIQIDCYYNDDLIPNTLLHLEKAWKNFSK
jgi:hypothetical protein